MSATVARVQLAVPAGQPVSALTGEQQNRLLERGRRFDTGVSASVTAIIESVRLRGDGALRELAARFEGAQLTTLEVSRARCEQALSELDPLVRSALEQAADSIRAFHAAQMPLPLEVEIRRGVRLGRRWEPLRSVGVYAPGGRAPYPSSVLMGAVPARVAGVDEIVVATPPGSDGLPARAVLAACAIAGADRVFCLGGAGAIAALALGTQTVPRVDKIVGPGNVYVTEAKRQLNGQVAIDCPAGPSEILILADESANADLIALELLAQAEHDPDAASVLVCTSAALSAGVLAALEEHLTGAARRDIIAAALAANGALLLAHDEQEMLRFAEQYAPEHLLLLTREPRSTVAHVRAAGSVFLGAGSSVVFGDYTSGANHVLPTAGRARAWSGLSTQDFLRTFTYQEIDASAAAALAEPTAVLADVEGLTAHARAARQRAGSTLTIGPRTPALRPAYRAVELYDPKRSPCEVDLSDNTNLFGIAPAVARVLSAASGASITRYPSVFGGALKQAIAQWFAVAPENVATGCGSDDIIDSALRAFCEPNDPVVYPEPGFSMVETFVRMNAAQPVAVPLTADCALDVNRLIQSRGRVTYVCRPNNPTGTVYARADIERLSAAGPGVLLLDEAYADFADDDFTRAAASSARMISLRTFSKAFGLAGMRIGFAIGPATLIHEIEKSRGPYKVGGLAEVAAHTLLTEAADWVRDGIAQVRANRERLYQALLRNGYDCLPSGGNFLLLLVPPGHSATSLAATLRSRGVAVRPFPGLPHLGDCVRITIGPWPFMERLLAELAA